ncbi:MAG: hypothetical protein HWN66_07035 [Candidatus Helarchaeota archaeon]|nr:hypothetical protein [Candidatus Helarchaeota archaeon]
MSLYWLGIAVALLAGASNNFGIVVEKKALNRLPEGQKVGRHLLKNRLWLLGFILNIVITSILVFYAEYLIGPTLVPGLEATGMIILAIGSLRLLKETIKTPEIIGISFMILAILCLSFSELAIDINTSALAETGFLIRVVIFTLILVVGSIVTRIVRAKRENLKGIAYAIDSGLMFGLNNFWIAPLIGLIDNIFAGSLATNELILLILAFVTLPIVNYFGIFYMQKSLEFGQASNMRPIQQAPVQIVPVFYFFAIFLLAPPQIFSLPLAISGIALILVSMLLLSRRAGQLEAIK